jgi:hypothetical protein
MLMLGAGARFHFGESPRAARQSFENVGTNTDAIKCKRRLEYGRCSRLLDQLPSSFYRTVVQIWSLVDQNAAGDKLPRSYPDIGANR